MLTRVCRSPAWTRLTRPATVTCMRYMCSDPDSTVISHRRTYLKRETKPEVKHDDPLWTTMYTKDLLFERLQSAQNLAEILDIIDKHHSSFRQRHIKHAFHVLKIFHKSEKVPASEVAATPQFRLLCRATVKLIRTFHAKELLTIFRLLVEFHVPPKALIFQSTIQMLRQSINDLYTENLLLLDAVLNMDIDKKHPADSDLTVGALRIALPLVLEIRLQNNEFESSNLSILVPALRVAVSKQLSGQLINKLMLLLKDQIDQMTFYPYLKVLNCLSSDNVNAERGVDMNLAYELATHCLRQLTQLVKSFESPENCDGAVIDLFFRMTYDRRLELYSKEFFDLVVETLCRKGADTSSLVRVAKHMVPYGHVSVDLVRKICENLSAEQINVDFDSAFSIGALQPLVVLSEFEPPSGWDIIVNNLYDDDMMSKAAVNATFQYLNILESMSLIGQYNSSFYSHMTDALTAMSTRPVPLGTIGQRLLNISLALKFDDHHLPVEQVTRMQQQLASFLEESVRVLNPIRKEETESSSSQLRETLVKALGGEDFLRCGIWSHGGHYHDYIVVMRKGDFPVAIGKEILELDFLENIKLPADRKLLSIVPLTERDYLREPPQMRRKTRFRIKMMQKAGFSVLPLHMKEFEEMPKREQLPFLMREITNAIREES